MADEDKFSADDLIRMQDESQAPKKDPPSGGVMPSSAQLSGEDLIKMTQPRAAPTVGFGEDIARAGAAGLGKGAIALTGLPGDIEKLGRAGLRYMGKDVESEPYFTTSEKRMQQVEEAIPGLKKHLDYTPDYDVNRYVKAGAEFLPGGLIGPGGLALKVAGSLGSGAASEAAGDLFKGKQLEGTPWETAARVAATIPGYGVGARAAKLAESITRPVATTLPVVGSKVAESAAMNMLAEKLAQDVGRGTTSLSSLQEGTMPAAGAGTQTRKALQQASEIAPNEAVQAFRTKTAESAGDATKNMQSVIDEIIGGGHPVDPFDKQANIIQDAKTMNGSNYKAAMSSPNAASISHPDLNAVVGALPKGTIETVADNMRKEMIDQSSMGMIRTGANSWTINPNGMPLKFWDYVKRDLDDKMFSLKDPVTGKITDPSEYRRLGMQNTMLKNVLDNAVKEYATARGAAAEAVGANNAVDLGMNFLTTPVGPKSEKRLNGMYDAFSKLTPEQKQNAAYGLAGSYKRMFETNPDAAFKLFTGPKGLEMQGRFRAIMGSDADQLIGQSMQQGLNRTVQSLREASTPSGMGILTSQIKSPTALGGASGLALSLGENLLQPSLWAGDMSALLVAAGFAGAGKLYSMSQAKIAGKMMQLASDPSKSEQLAKLVAKDPNARSFMQKTLDTLGAGAGRVAGAQAAQTDRNSGGRVGRATGGRLGGFTTAAMLVAAAERAKKNNGKTTEALLNQPDEAITRALAIANRRT